MDGHYYPKEDRRVLMDRRTRAFSDHQPGNTDGMGNVLEDLLPQMADNTSKITECLDRIVDQNERLLNARLQQIEVVTKFFDNLNKVFTNELPAQSQSEPRTRAADYSVSGQYTKADILELIRQMREKGSTFSVIAQHLVDLGIPTFSGRGHWHAQTIHRLCK